MILIKRFSIFVISILLLSCQKNFLFQEKFQEKIEINEAKDSKLLVKYTHINECGNSDQTVLYEVDQDGNFSYKPIKNTIPIPPKAWLREGTRKLSSDELNQIKELLNTSELEKLSKEITFSPRQSQFEVPTCIYLSSLTIRDGIKEKTFKIQQKDKKYPQRYNEIIGKITSKLYEFKNINIGNHKYTYSIPLSLHSRNNDTKVYSSYNLEKDGNLKYYFSNGLNSNILVQNVKLTSSELEEFLLFLDKINIAEKGETLTTNSTNEALELQKKSLTHKSPGLKVNNIQIWYEISNINVKENEDYQKAFMDIEEEIKRIVVSKIKKIKVK